MHELWQLLCMVSVDDNIKTFQNLVFNLFVSFFFQWLHQEIETRFHPDTSAVQDSTEQDLPQ